MSDERTEPGWGLDAGDAIDSEGRVVGDFGLSLAAAAQRCLEHHGKLQVARYRDEHDPVESGPTRVERLRSALRGFLRRTIATQTIALAVMDGGADDPLTTTQE